MLILRYSDSSGINYEINEVFSTCIDLLALSHDNDVAVTQLVVGASRHPYDVSFVTTASQVHRVIR